MQRRSLAVLMTGLCAVSLSVSSNAIFGSSKRLSEIEMNDTRGRIPMLCAKIVSCNKATWPDNPRAYDCNESPRPLSCNNCQDGVVDQWMIGAQAGTNCPGFMQQTSSLTNVCGIKYRGSCQNGVCVNLQPPEDPDSPLFQCRTWVFEAQGVY